MAARTSIIDESADDGVPADFWNEVLDSFEVMDEWAEGSEEAKKAAEERARKKKEDDLEKVRKFNEAWNIAPAAEEEAAAPTRIVVEASGESSAVVESTTPAMETTDSDSRSKSPDCAIIPEEREVITVEEDNIPVAENSVVVIPADGLPEDPRLKRIQETVRVQSPSSPTQDGRNAFVERELAPSNRYFQDRDREREEQIRKDREDFERARSRLRSRSPRRHQSSRRSMSDDEDDIGQPFPRRMERSRSRYRSRSHGRHSRSPRRAKSSRRSRSRSRDRVRSRRSTRSRSRSRSRPRRDLTDELRDRLMQSGSGSGSGTGDNNASAAMMNQMTAMMQMMMDPTKMMSMNPMMAMMMQMNPMMAAAAAAAMQKTAEAAKETPVAEQQDKKDDITAQLFLDSKINLSDFLATRCPNEGKKSTRVNPRVTQRIKEAITILDKQETKVQTAKFLYVAPTYHQDLKKLDNRSPLIWNDQNVLYSLTSKSKDVGLCEPFRNVNHKMKQMIERLGLDEGNISQRIAQLKKEKTSTQSGADVGTIQAITIVPVRGGAASKRVIERSIQTEEFNCLDCVQRRSKTYVSVNTQTAVRARTIEVSVQTDRDRDVELHSMNDLNANQVKILNEIMRYMKKRQVSGNMSNLMNNLERDVPELRNQHLNAGLHYVSEILEQSERNANRYAGPNPMNAKAREMASVRGQGGAGSRDPRARGSFKDDHHGVNFDAINQLTTSIIPAGFRPSPPRRTNNSGSFNKRRAW
ncbi:uncharacterized protein LOC109415779 isoform X1 [Aedes albopictus]|uniref:Putative receptor-mediated endocytosis n=1 Tax=Aedes albopictus TaxID=7160 RepID=A0A023EVS0_AEDAL|nr:uncharacterized protein LOC109415779 [Aedes albopictus]